MGMRVQVGGTGPGLLAAVSGLPLLAHLSVSYYNSMRALDRVALLDALPLLRRCPHLSRLDLLYMPVRAEQVRPGRVVSARCYAALRLRISGAFLLRNCSTALTVTALKLCLP